MSDKILELKNIQVCLGNNTIIEKAELTIHKGEIVALVGPNGAGKSTILKTIFGLTPYVKGVIKLNQKNLYPLPHKMPELGLAYIPQGRRIFPGLTIKENLRLGAFGERNNMKLKRKMEEILGIFPVLKDKFYLKSGTLSGGQQQLLSMARALMIDPQILLMDEPTIGLAPKTMAEIFKKIKEMNKTKKISILLVDHNIKSLLTIADNVYILNRGITTMKINTKKIEENNLFKKIFF